MSLDNKKISICVPTYNRYLMTIKCFEDILHDERVEQIVIVDDASFDGSYEKLKEHFNDNDKVKLFQNAFNLDCYANKYVSVTKAKSDYVILADSDNVFTKDYLDKIYSYEWHPKTIFTPEFASPHFNFENYSGMVINKNNVSSYIDLPFFETMLNACNFFVHRLSYIETWDSDTDPVTSDSIYMAMRWINSGNEIFVVPKLTYTHTVHKDSHYQNNNYRTKKGFHENILQQLRNMK